MGLASSFWVALPALLLVMGAMGVTSPVRSAYLHQVVPTEQRATVVSFDSMVSNVGGIGGQVGLGALGEARSVGSAFVVGGLATAAALPLLGAAASTRRQRRRHRRSSEPASSARAPAPGIPAVSSVETHRRTRRPSSPRRRARA